MPCTNHFFSYPGRTPHFHLLSFLRMPTVRAYWSRPSGASLFRGRTFRGMLAGTGRSIETFLEEPTFKTGTYNYNAGENFSGIADGGECVGIGGAEEAEGLDLVVGDAAFAVDDDDAACRAAGQPAFHSVKCRDLAVGI